MSLRLAARSAARGVAPPLAAALLSLMPLFPASAETLDEALARGDAAWQRRTEGHRGDRADPGPIGEAVAAYTSAVEAAPESFSARHRLLRALYYQGDYAVQDTDAKLAIFERGREVAETGLDQVAGAVGGRERLDALEPEELPEALATVPEAAEAYYWAAVHWGFWGRHRGKLAAARQGVAGKVRDFAEAVVALDERLENAGGLRILGRLHTEAPKLPFVTGWVDRDTAVTALERAHRNFPEDLGLQLYFAEALIEFRRERKAEGMEILRAIVAAEPHPDYLLEGLRFQADARALLDRHG